ncbi:MAG TPA: CUAEP/CCAEP-tail radical SAM protein [Bryobacteraceae bacterium]|nr:CUAEP/CCAEP-tail radical SAM protein [Bryobacteraceae bacterium]
MRILLISTYELGRQPFGLASPAACLRADGHEVTCADIAVEKLPLSSVRDADLIAVHLPMHTATRLAASVIEAARQANPKAHVCCYGLYASVNAGYLHSLGVGAILGGEFEGELRSLARQLAAGDRRVSAEPLVSLDRLHFEVPDRSGLPPLTRYASMLDGEARRITGYTEASRGCKHLCRHCPIVPVYNGTFRVVPADIVIADIRQQVEAGAQHITFGDPDFFNGPAHGMRIVQRMNREFPALTYDVTIKIEHLLKRRDLLPELRRTGCLLVTTAVESIDDEVLQKLDKGHTKADFLEVVRLFHEQDLNLSPTFIPFTPWTTWEGYRELLRTLAELELVHQVAPVQLALRLLIPAGSRLLELEEIRDVVDTFQPDALAHIWRHSDPSMDQLAARLLQLVHSEQRRGASRAECFAAIWAEAGGNEPTPVLPCEQRRAPQLSEPWYCCAEPMPERAARI